MSDSNTKLADGQEISYKAYSRTFGSAGDGAVIYVVATAAYPIGGYDLFFRQDGGNKWSLWQSHPGPANQLVTYYIASGTTSQHLLDPPSELEIEDAYGTHTVPVQAW